MSHEVRLSVLGIDRRFGNIERIDLGQHAELTEDRRGQPILNAGIAQPAAGSSLGQSDENLGLHVGPEHIVVGQLHTDRNILVDLSHQPSTQPCHAAAELAVPNEVVSTEVAVHTVTTEERNRAADFGVEAGEGLFRPSRAVEKQSVTDEVGVRRIQHRTERVVTFADRHVAVCSEIDKPTERLEAQSDLVITLGVTGVEVVPRRQADDAINVFHPPAPTGTDVRTTFAVVSHDGPDIAEQNRRVVLNGVRQEHPQVRVTWFVTVQAAATRIHVDTRPERPVVLCVAPGSSAAEIDLSHVPAERRQRGRKLSIGGRTQPNGTLRLCTGHSGHCHPSQETEQTPIASKIHRLLQRLLRKPRTRLVVLNHHPEQLRSRRR